MKSGELEDYLTAELGAFPCQTALLMEDLDTGEVYHSRNADLPVVAASTIKVPILFAALEWVRQGKLSLTQMVPLPASAILADTQVFDRGLGAYSLWEILYWMIVESDNTATNLMLDTLGYAWINDYARDTLGLTATTVQRNMLDWQAVAEGRNNYTSARDQGRLYRQLYRGALLTPALCQVAMDMLCRQRATDLFLRYIPDPIVLAHKTGGLDYLNHDAGMFLLEHRHFYLGIFTWDGPSTEGEAQQKKFIGRLAAALYEAYR